MPQLIFQAIADPTRREIIDLLAASPMPVNDVASHFDISRPAISRHIKILQECGLVVIRQSGRKRYCRADTQKLQEIIARSEEHTSELQSRGHLVCRLLLEETRLRS